MISPIAIGLIIPFRLEKYSRVALELVIANLGVIKPALSIKDDWNTLLLDLRIIDGFVRDIPSKLSIIPSMTE
ncbi:hypothetical protein D3C84_874300 [compost metagenome]